MYKTSVNHGDFNYHSLNLGGGVFTSIFPLNKLTGHAKGLKSSDSQSSKSWEISRNIWVAFFCWLWGIIILLVPTRGLRLAYAATVGAYAGTSCRKFAYAAYARVVLLRRCLRGYSPGSFSPPVRWGLLDFMWVVFSSASSSSPLRPPRPQLRWCELSVPCRTSTAIMWAQCSLPDLNRDHVSTAFRAGPQPRSCVAQCASGDC